jgi:hypothetical protein
MKLILALLFMAFITSCSSSTKTEPTSNQETTEVKTKPKNDKEPSNGGLDL